MWIWTCTEFQIGETQAGLPADALFVDHSHCYTVLQFCFT